MKLYKSAEQFYLSHYYLIIPLAIILLSCLGGFAVYYITIKGMTLFNFFQMFLCVVGAVLYLTSVLAQMPRKSTFVFLFYGLLLEIILLAYNLSF
ncbi:hypothetical protein N9H69_00780 [Flavobacteriaceae bacterium]|nr:hypothetical protein [Flavobacteriaceae bacterium]MDB3862105.1 hypothetical protein [Flavobacteriaceae bacterium]MDC3354390.1 hypothetical protein [Flavobacteriaceae bacterium]